MRAVLSIGTNSTRLLIAERSGASWTPVRHLRRGTRLGEGLGPDGELRPQAVERTLDAAEAFAHVARSAGAEVRVIATSAMRRARDAGAFAQELERRTGLRLRVIPGQDEARYSFIGALAGHGHGMGADAPVGVLDAGGGSTELAVGTHRGLERSRSFEIGAVRLTESTPLREDPPPQAALAEARRQTVEALHGIVEVGAGTERLICVGGTATTCASMLARGEREGELVDGARIVRRELTELLERIAPMTLAERRALPGLPAQRADIIVGGLIVLEQVFLALGIATAIVSIHDLLLGYIVGGWR